MNVNTGATWQSNSNAGYTIGEREPEGMAIYLDSSLTRSSAKLCFRPSWIQRQLSQSTDLGC